ncbi:MAG: type II toxin-antitoxin system HicA family toxin [Deltaproteobacteria bacterium]|jgi:hypothetical protein|nr:type II toxin-antitoxin system HicA family toxin [Deltaproteobacteria bacterium]
MVQADKRLRKMRDNPRDWRIEELQSVAGSLGIEWMHDGSSHVIFRSPYGEHLSIPARRPIKPIYITKFVALADSVQEMNNERSQEQNRNPSLDGSGRRRLAGYVPRPARLHV